MADQLNIFMDGFYPYGQKIELYLSHSLHYVEGIRSLFKDKKETAILKALDDFQGQVEQYDLYIKSSLLERRRREWMIPQPLYEAYLNQCAVNASPQQILEQARNDFESVSQTYKNLLKRLASKNNLKEETPEALISFYSKDSVAEPAKILDLYAKANEYIKNIIINYDLIELPAHTPRIRLGSIAETTSLHVPRVNPPPYFENKGERCWFIVPTPEASNVDIGDFNWPAAVNLISHEVRPGHELHASQMFSSSALRAFLFIIPAQVKGWALYAEDMVFPYLAEEEQFMALRMKLLRIARMFLEPQLHLGQITPKEAFQILQERVGIQEHFARSELNGYLFQCPGHAPSYYFGFKKIQATKQKLKNLLQGQFSKRLFNTKIASYGMIPMKMIEANMLEEAIK